ncbi:MAG: threonine/serine dehydratase [Marinoscillum sp.]|uniref:threonine ammonia-lyase n=1 Tax=Marinoscillum sp. TaxID=2024838 RepID=UPI0032F5747D
MESIPSLSDIKRAHQRISKIILETPVMTSNSIDEMTGCTVFFKCENFQKVGAFKMRGAANMILGFRPEERVNGFATHSSGNHAQAVALAAKLSGTKAYVVMPENSAEVKIKATKEYGAEVILCEANEKSRIKTCNEIIAKTGAIFVPPFDDYRVIAGQATVAKEFIEAEESLEVIMTPVGGGGLAAGTALAAKYLDPNIEVILGEPEKADDTYQSMKAGKIMPVKNPNTIADGLKVTVGKRNFEIIQKEVKEVITVSEAEIITAMRIIWERMKIIVEPSCAVPFAALLKRKDTFAGKNVGIILTGGNVDLGNLPF